MLDGGLEPETGQGIASAHWHQGAAALTCGVDDETGVTEIAGLEVAVYAGRVVDASGAALQNDGSIVMGIGSALFEATEYADGQMLTTTFSDYQVPAFSDIPPFTAEIVEGGEAADVHGLGETALPLVPAALGNALRSLGAAAVAHARAARAVLEALGTRALREPAHDAERRASARSRSRGDEPLIDVLRDAGLASVRLSCGIGLCGACTVLLDGDPVSSCLLHAALAEGREVTTVEGLAGDDPRAARVRRGRRVPVRLLHAGHGALRQGAGRHDPRAGPAEVRHWMNGNLCRCGSYRRIEQAIAAYLEEVRTAALTAVRCVERRSRRLRMRAGAAGQICAMSETAIETRPAWEWRAMGATWRLRHTGKVEIEVVGALADAIAADERRWSRFLARSEVSRLNRAPGVPLQVSTETLDLLLACDRWHEQTEARSRSWSAGR